MGKWEIANILETANYGAERREILGYGDKLHMRMDTLDTQCFDVVLGSNDALI